MAIAVCPGWKKKEYSFISIIFKAVLMFINGDRKRGE